MSARRPLAHIRVISNQRQVNPETNYHGAIVVGEDSSHSAGVAVGLRPLLLSQTNGVIDFAILFFPGTQIQVQTLFQFIKFILIWLSKSFLHPSSSGCNELPLASIRWTPSRITKSTTGSKFRLRSRRPVFTTNP